MFEKFEQEFFNKLADVLEKQFPKGKCKERGAALVLNSMANIFLKDILKQIEKQISQNFEDGHLDGWIAACSEIKKRIEEMKNETKKN